MTLRVRVIIAIAQKQSHDNSIFFSLFYDESIG